jgi:hypothetical protein
MSIETELLKIKGSKEMLTAEEVVDWAQAHPKSKLHKAPEFCGWDLNKSAREHWIWGARRLIALNIRYEDGTRKFVSLTADRSRTGGGYRDVDDVVRDQMLHEMMLADALRDLKRVEEKYERLNELKPVWTAASKVRAKKAKQEEKRASA